MEILNLQTTYLLLGSNLGNSKEILENAMQAIEERVGKIILCSKYYETAPWGVENQPNYLNIALAVDTLLSAVELLKQTQQIEDLLGRVRKEKWGARLIDVDIIFYGDAVINLPDLVIPHPLMQERNFVLVPLQEIAPDFEHPTLKKTIQNLYNTCDDVAEVKVLNYLPLPTE